MNQNRLGQRFFHLLGLLSKLRETKGAGGASGLCSSAGPVFDADGSGRSWTCTGEDDRYGSFDSISTT